MNKFLALLCLALMASASAKPGYNYSPPSKGTSGNFKQQQQGFRPSQPASNSNVYTANLSEQINLGNGFSGPVSTQNTFSSTAAAGGVLQPQVQLAQPFAPPVQQFVSSVQQPPQQQQQQQFIGPAPQFVAPPQQQQQQQQFTAPASQFAAPVQVQQQQQQPQQFAAPIAQFSVSNQQQQQQQQFLAPTPVAQFQSINFQQPAQQNQQQTLISKDIYIHSAPDEVEEIGTDVHSAPAGPIRKNYRIVFIKAPTQNVKLNVNALKRSQASNEEKTVIYVLSKKPDLSEIQGQLVAAQSEQKAHKPEVYFIKYKTQEEANRAQQEIQAQYDSLGGSTHISDEGVAPVHSVIGGGPLTITNIDGVTNPIIFQGSSNLSQQKFVQHSHQNTHTISGGSSSTVNFGGAPAQAYLPAKKK